jgi:glycosyl-4,4'-diaponeurosporenoate acyltransferase
MTLVIVLNVLGWPLIHLLVSKLAFARARHGFDPEAWLYRPRSWEGEGRLYERLFRIKRWKSWLPDGAALLGNPFTKKRLQRRDAAYLHDFRFETCRGEWAHWITLSCAPIFFLWNPLWADLVMIIYALAANLPCILVQRYNRLLLRRILLRFEERPSRAVFKSNNC